MSVWTLGRTLLWSPNYNDYEEDEVFLNINFLFFFQTKKAEQYAVDNVPHTMCYGEREEWIIILIYESICC